ncbi:histone deacetylase family protein [Novispirillum sp. DQ9]|uniref:histone deacetylase family protein n=1 Tax=Novispirillum sp. DQ9 TaxID=3398612 RepID=UPI003C7B1BCF
MRCILNAAQAGHDGGLEFNEGRLVPCHEGPERAAMVLAAWRAAGLGAEEPARDVGLAPILAVHDAAYVAFLRTARERWTAAGRDGQALPFTFAARGLRRDVPPQDIDGLLGYYGFDAGSPIVAGTWDAAYGAAQAALTGAALLGEGERAAFALVRPPGHHAGRSSFGGYCFLNNAAIAAQALRDAGHARVSVLDVDYHHGNGTQDIFWERGDVQVVSLHADPRQEFPYFLGHADERGAGDGLGATLNLPLPWGTGWTEYGAALETACAAVADFAPTALVVSLGVDTWEGDPISRFALRHDHFRHIGARIKGLGLPTLFVLEGGYAVAEIGRNVVAVLEGFEGRWG